MRYLLLGIFLIAPLISTATSGGNEHGVGVGGPDVPANPEIQDTLEALENPDILIQWLTLRNLKPSQIRHPMVQEQLTKMSSKSDPVIQWKVKIILKENQSSIYRQLVNNIFNKVNIKARQIAAKVSPPNLATLKKKLNEGLMDSDPTMLRETIKTIGDLKINDPIAQLMLIKFLKEPDPTVQIEIIQALGKSRLTDSAVQRSLDKTTAAFDPNITKSVKDIEPTQLTQEQLDKFLDTVKFSQLIIPKHLTEILSNSTNLIVQWEAIEALKLRSPNDLTVHSTLIELLPDLHPILRLEAINILNFALLDDNSIAHIRRLAADTFIAISATKVIRKIMLNDSILQRKLTQLTHDPDPEIRKSAQIALNNINAQENETSTCPKAF